MKLTNGLKTAICAFLCAGVLQGTESLAIEKAAVQAHLAASQPVEFDVYLPLEHQAELDVLLNDLQDPKSASYQKWLKPAEFHARFGASADKVAAIQRELAGYGLTAKQVSAQKLHVSGKASAVEQVFVTELHAATFKSGKTTVAAVRPISLPASIASSHATVVGLSGTLRLQADSKRMGAIRQVSPDNRYGAVGPYWFDDLRQAYSYPSYLKYTGNGWTIGILMTGDYNRSDMKNYFNHEGMTIPYMFTFEIDGGAPYDPDGSFETHLDLQQTGGMAHGAEHILYNVPDLSDQSLIDGLLAIDEDNLTDVVSMSFGGPELGYTAEYNGGQDYTGLLAVYDDLFKQGNAQGITFVASSGDSGALSVPPLACFDPDATSACGKMQVSANFPATDPHVVAVGGTNLTTTGGSSTLNSNYVHEGAWDNALSEDIFYGTPATGAVWGSGGGDSIYFNKPTYQKVVNTGSSFRTVPDVSLQMGGCPFGTIKCPIESSATVTAIDGGLYGVIGTSVSAPDFAALVLFKAERFGHRLGNENFGLYALAATQANGGLQVFRNNMVGTNGYYTTSGNGSYNRVVGNGTVIGVNYLQRPDLPVAGTPLTPSNP